MEISKMKENMNHIINKINNIELNLKNQKNIDMNNIYKLNTSFKENTSVDQSMKEGNIYQEDNIYQEGNIYQQDISVDESMKEDISVDESMKEDKDFEEKSSIETDDELNNIDDILDNIDLDIDFDNLDNIDTSDIELEQLSIKELKTICKELKLPVSGNKTKLIQRINEKKNIN